MSPDHTHQSRDFAAYESGRREVGVDYVLAVLDVFGHAIARDITDLQLGQYAIAAERALQSPHAEPSATAPQSTTAEYTSELIQKWAAIQEEALARLGIGRDGWYTLMAQHASSVVVPLLTLRIRPTCTAPYPLGIMLTGTIGQDFPDDTLIRILRYRARIIEDRQEKKLTYRTAVYVPGR